MPKPAGQWPATTGTKPANQEAGKKPETVEALIRQAHRLLAGWNVTDLGPSKVSGLVRDYCRQRPNGTFERYLLEAVVRRRGMALDQWEWMTKGFDPTSATACHNVDPRRAVDDA